MLKFAVATSLILVSMSAQAAPKADPGLCVALRGNGFRIASHFGALAKVVETEGIPDVVVGSSSGSISAFMMDSIAANPFLSRDAEKRKLEAALLLKSVPEYIVTLLNEPELQIAQEFATDKEKVAEAKAIAAGLGDLGLISKLTYVLKQAITSGTFRDLAKVYTSVYFKELLNPDFKAYLDETGKMKEQMEAEKDASKKSAIEAIVKYRGKQVADALGASTKFDARNDANLLFRSGILNHKGMVRVWDRMASLYAGYNLSEAQTRTMKSWMNRCAAPSAGKTLEETEKANPRCGRDFRSLAKSYLSDYKTFSSYPTCRLNVRNQGACVRYRHDDKLAQNLNSFVITSAFVGNSIEKYTAMQSQFPTTIDPDFGRKFRLKFADMRIGLYGDQNTMSASRRAIQGSVTDSSGRTFDFSNDFKSDISIPLGNVTWMEAISKSTAEPGQAGAKIIETHTGEKLLSLGGWPDPNPIQPLKGLGCKTSIAVVTTIKSGNNFGEQVMGNIFADMSGLRGLSDDDIAFGTDDTTSNWGKWRNHANPNSSENLGFQAAEAVYCTQWDEVSAIDMKTGLAHNMRALAKVGYDGAIFIPEDVASNHPIRSSALPRITREQNVFDARLNRPLYNGCIAPKRK